MAKFRKKPVVIEAFQFLVDPIPDWFWEKVNTKEIVIYYGDSYCLIETLEGVMRGDCNDFIIQGINGEIYPCKPDIFEKTYEKV